MTTERIKYYDSTGLLSMKDSDGLKPAIYIAVSRVRGPGKTHSFSKKLMDFYFQRQEKFMLLVRNKYEVGNSADGIFKSMLSIEYPELSIVEKGGDKMGYSDVYVSYVDESVDEDEDVKPQRVQEHVGYVVSLRASDQIKKISSKFHDVHHMFFDEFQPKSFNDYLPDEVSHFYDIYKSVARGGGSSTRHVNVYLSSNTITVANPWFVELGITHRVMPNTKSLKGPGWVLQVVRNEALVRAHAGTAFDRAFSGLRIGNYADDSWLNDSSTGILPKVKGWGQSDYIGTLVIDDKTRYGFRYYRDVDRVHVSRSVDESSSEVFRLDKVQDPSARSLRRSQLGVVLRIYAQEANKLFFQDQKCKLETYTHLM